MESTHVNFIGYGIPIATTLFVGSWTYNWLTTPGDVSRLEAAKKNGKQAKFTDIPGPVALPLFGSMMQLFPYASKKRIDMFFNGLNEKYGTLARVNLLGKNFLLVSDATAMKQILHNTEEINRDERPLKAFQGMTQYSLGLMPYGDAWKRHRKGLQPAFAPNHLKQGFEMSVETVDKLLEIWSKLIDSGKSERDIFFDSTLVTSDIIGKFSLGVDFKGVLNAETNEKPQVLLLLDSIIKFFIVRFYLVDLSFLWSLFGVSLAQITPLTSQLREILQKPIEQKRVDLESGKFKDTRDKDVLELLLSPAIKPGSGDEVVFTEEEIIDEVITFYFAGHETTALFITMLVYLLAKHPDVLKRAREEVDALTSGTELTMDHLNNFTYLDAVLKETHRLYTVAPQFTRMVQKPAVLKSDEGYEVAIPPGVEVMMNYGGIHRNKKLWGESANEFRPERWLENHEFVPGSYVPFGGGHHICIGMKLATIESKVFLIRMIQRFEFKIVEVYEAKIEYGGTCGLRKLNVEVKRRN